MSLEVLKHEGLKLEPTERTQLVHFLIDSLVELEVDEVELSAEQQSEIDGRLEAFENGAMELIDGEAFQAQLRAKYGL